MSDLIQHTPKPRTRDTIRRDLQEMGIQKGMTIMVHSSLSSIGWVNGGAVAVIQALMDVVTEQGNIVMPSQSDDAVDPSYWSKPSVPEEWWEEIRNTFPAYHPNYTPASRMGQIVDIFRTFPNVKRSSHPHNSFAAWGKDSETIIQDHSLDFSFGEESPLKTLYDLDANILFIGTDYGSCTAFHLAENRTYFKEIITKKATVLENDEEIRKSFQDLETREDLFEQIGLDFEKQYGVTKGLIGSASSRLFSLQEAVDYAEKWLNHYYQSG
ncbi:AAC(3) family N-acetyltransferase [Pontibacillus marinus]|uniref:Aminoglycoside N(3)-acetyltransferase n=1 Tax=Pontibacillus marinus BH030004 = DSM 16465 TaxID=1385511 RepID=A0A0A5G2X0_9BACI|nr:AAC(3) family N-acetyltransferase [Pontibacillus marinus]KGX85425.1 aminoglycoside N(3')-acetyltransferase [Pontibacillus marinus BH030004 = DSM 16465]